MGCSYWFTFEPKKPEIKIINSPNLKISGGVEDKVLLINTKKTSAMAEKSFGVKDLNIVGASGDPTIESNGDLNLKKRSSCNPD